LIEVRWGFATITSSPIVVSVGGHLNHLLNWLGDISLSFDPIVTPLVIMPPAVLRTPVIAI